MEFVTAVMGSLAHTSGIILELWLGRRRRGGGASLLCIVNCGYDFLDGHDTIAVDIAEWAEQNHCLIESNVDHSLQLIDGHGTATLTVADAWQW